MHWVEGCTVIRSKELPGPLPTSQHFPFAADNTILWLRSEGLCVGSLGPERLVCCGSLISAEDVLACRSNSSSNNSSNSYLFDSQMGCNGIFAVVS